MSRMQATDEELAEEWPYLTRLQVEEFKKAFRVFDKDGRGTISARELRVVFSSLGQKPTREELDALIKEIDVNGDGEIDFCEFLTMMLHNMNNETTEKDLLDVFTVFDKDQSGTVSRKELKAAMRIIDGKLTNEEIDTAISLADSSGDGEVDYEEFISFVLYDNNSDHDPETPFSSANLTRMRTASMLFTSGKSGKRTSTSKGGGLVSSSAPSATSHAAIARAITLFQSSAKSMETRTSLDDGTDAPVAVGARETVVTVPVSRSVSAAASDRLGGERKSSMRFATSQEGAQAWPIVGRRSINNNGMGMGRESMEGGLEAHPLDMNTLPGVVMKAHEMESKSSGSGVLKLKEVGKDGNLKVGR